MQVNDLFSYVVGKMHDRLIKGLSTINSAEDEDIVTLIEQLQHVSQVELGKY
jgi:hypothetical protein